MRWSTMCFIYAFFAMWQTGVMYGIVLTTLSAGLVSLRVGMSRVFKARLKFWQGPASGTTPVQFCFAMFFFKQPSHRANVFAVSRTYRRLGACLCLEFMLSVACWYTFSGCIVVTGQEAPGSGQRLRDDLFKKTLSGDGIAGRKPYGLVTRMMCVIGWKR